MGLLATPARQPCRVLLPCPFRIGSSVFRCFLLCFSIAGWMPAASDGWKEPCGWMMGLIATHSHCLFSRLLQMIFRLFGGCLLFHCRMFAVGWIGSRVCTISIPLPHLQGTVMKFFLIEGFPCLDFVLSADVP